MASVAPRVRDVYDGINDDCIHDNVSAIAIAERHVLIPGVYVQHIVLKAHEYIARDCIQHSVERVDIVEVVRRWCVPLCRHAIIYCSVGGGRGSAPRLNKCRLDPATNCAMVALDAIEPAAPAAERRLWIRGQCHIHDVAQRVVVGVGDDSSEELMRKTPIVAEALYEMCMDPGIRRDFPMPLVIAFNTHGMDVEFRATYGEGANKVENSVFCPSLDLSEDGRGLARMRSDICESMVLKLGEVWRERALAADEARMDEIAEQLRREAAEQPVLGEHERGLADAVERAILDDRDPWVDHHVIAHLLHLQHNRRARGERIPVDDRRNVEDQVVAAVPVLRPLIEARRRAQFGAALPRRVVAERAVLPDAAMMAIDEGADAAQRENLMQAVLADAAEPLNNGDVAAVRDGVDLAHVLEGGDDDVFAEFLDDANQWGDMIRGPADADDDE